MQIAFVSAESEIDPDDDNVDVHVRLDDGREYSLLLATPKNIYKCMDNESIDYFFGVPPLLVRRLTRDNAERAIRALLSEPRFLNVYATLQGNANATE
jgi:hypothetical protein